MLRFIGLLTLALVAASPLQAQPVTPTPAPTVVPEIQESILVEGASPDEADSARDTSSSVTIVEINRQKDGLTPLSDILSRTVGIEVKRYGGLGSFSTLSIRGSSPAQVTLYLDGVPLTDAATGLVNIDDFPVASLNRVEVYRGSAPGRFASAGIGGVVNLVTRRAGTSPEWQVSGDVGQYATAGGRGSAALRKGPVAGRATIHALRSDGDFTFFDDNGTPLNPDDDEEVERQNNEVRQVDGGLRLDFKLGRSGSLDFGAELFDKDQGVPGPGQDQAEQTRFSTRRALLRLGGRLDDFLLPGGSFQATVYGSSRREHYSDPIGEVGIGVQDQVDRFKEIGLRLQTESPLAEGTHRLTALAEAQYETYEHEDLRTLPVPGPRTSESSRWNLSFVVEDPFLFGGGAWELTPRLRLQHLENDFAATELSDGPAPEPSVTAFSPSLGMRRNLDASKLELKANASRSFRAPNFYELFGDRGTVIGNPGLQPEDGWNFDASVARVGPLWNGRLQRIEATLFASFVDDLIVYLQNSQRTFRPFNIGAARTLGLEAMALGRIGRADVSLAYTLQDARDQSGVSFLDGNELPGRSQHHLAGELRYPIEPVRLSTSVELLSANYLDRANLEPVGARFYQSLGAVLESRGGWPEIGVELRNLWDEQTADVGGFPLPGRSIFLSVRWRSSTSAQ